MITSTSLSMLKKWEHDEPNLTNSFNWHMTIGMSLQVFPVHQNNPKNIIQLQHADSGTIKTNDINFSESLESRTWKVC